MDDYKQKLFELAAIVSKEGASDLHLTAGKHPSIRISGSLIPLLKEKILSPEDVAGLIFSMLDEKTRQRLVTEKDFDFSHSFDTPGGQMRFRVNAFYQQGSLGAALRLIPVKIKTFTELGLPESLADFANKKQGFFLIVGPIGHGKSTTMASMIDYINRKRSEHILTIEDPIEYVFTPDKSIIDQREIGFDTKDFAVSLRSMFRQDVNVAMIGEMRDPETISTATTAAETGHLIFSSVHTNSASQTIDRIIDAFPSDQQHQIRIQLANTLLGIFSQRLVPKVSGGLVPAYELLVVNSAVRNLIRENRTNEINMIIETSAEIGMISLNKSLSDLVRKGEITAESAYSYSLSPKSLEGLL
jgi:twitching motility protein PilT